MPDGLDFKQAASVTLGAIAMQGVRRTTPTFGETVAVIGLGLVGQITVQVWGRKVCLLQNRDECEKTCNLSSAPIKSRD